MVSSKEKAVEKVLTTKTLTIGIVLVIVMTIWSTFASGFMSIGGLLFSMGQNVVGMPTGALLVLGLMFLVSLSVPKLGLSAKEIAIIYVMMAVTIAHAGYFFPWCFYNMLVGIRVYQAEVWSKYFPPWWAPSTADIEPVMLGEQPPAFGAWAGPIIYWLIFMSIVQIWTLAFASIWRRRWIEEERLPYPFGAIALETIQYIGKEKDPGRAKLFQAGVAIGFLFYIPFILHLGWPWFPDIYGWFSAPFMSYNPGMLDLYQAGVTLPASNLYFMIAPYMWGWFYLLSMDVLLTTWLSWIIGLVILPTIAYTFGAYPVGTVGSGFPSSNPPFSWWMFSYIGIVLGLAVSPFFFQLGYVRRTINAAMKGPTPEEKENELMPYRMAYIMFVLGFILLVGLTVMSGSEVITGIWGWLWVLLYLFAWSRLRGEAGPLSSIFTMMTFFRPFYAPIYEAGSMDNVTVDYAINNTTHFVTISDAAYGVTIGAYCYPQDAYKVADGTKTKASNLLVPILIATPLSILISSVIAVWCYYVIGFPKIPIHGDGTWWVTIGAPAGHTLFSGPWPTWVPGMIAGAVLTILMYLARFMWAWFPLNPVGMFIGVAAGQQWWGVASAALVAWIAKMITFRVGGTKMYEERGVPIAVGLVIGFTIALLVGSFVSIYRTMVPV